MNVKPKHLVQLVHPEMGRRVALVNEPELVFIKNFHSVYALALEAIDTGQKLDALVDSNLSEEKLEYDPVYNGNIWKLLPSFDHPENPFGCLVSGTGLTHKNSALNRQMMHTSAENKPTDSLRMYQWGVEGGTPGKGKIGVQPEWFYKGNGHILKAHGEQLSIPSYANDGGEEPEVAGIYIIDRTGQPYRIGFSTGNEFSDHIMEKKNYLYLAPSKLRECAIGPEVCITEDFAGFAGTVSIQRNEEIIWSAAIKTGEENMAHTLANMEHHHFKYAAHRVPLQAHVHYFGADAFSFGNNITLDDGDIMQVEWKGLGRALKNPLHVSKETERLIGIKTV